MSDRRTKISLVCEECGSRNYRTTKPKNPQPGERLALKKFCRNCNRHTEHKESK